MKYIILITMLITGLGTQVIALDLDKEIEEATAKKKEADQIKLDLIKKYQSQYDSKMDEQYKIYIGKLARDGRSKEQIKKYIRPGNKIAKRNKEEFEDTAYYYIKTLDKIKIKIKIKTLKKPERIRFKGLGQ